MSLRERLRWKAIGILGRALLRLWAGTCRTAVIGDQEYNKLRREGRPVILLTWHGRLLFALYFFRRRGIAALVSPSKDGEIIAQIASGWGFRILRGSGSHAVVRAWNEMKSELRQGGELIIIPDGPKGPDRFLKPGCLKLAQETGAFLVPFSFSASLKRFLGSWDHFLLFYPFSRIVAVFGPPIRVMATQDEQDFEEERRKLEILLSRLDAAADRYFEKG
ncbi:MAG: lysophospholipid acyltransferase family protein [Clostridiales bacterium]|nr:lysophospholipid acyltransferase family protein [Clostridiales bacterium]